MGLFDGPAGKCPDCDHEGELEDFIETVRAKAKLTQLRGGRVVFVRCPDCKTIISAGMGDD